MVELQRRCRRHDNGSARKVSTFTAVGRRGFPGDEEKATKAKVREATSSIKDVHQAAQDEAKISSNFDSKVLDSFKIYKFKRKNGL